MNQSRPNVSRSPDGVSPPRRDLPSIHQGAAWLLDIAYILEPVPTHPLRAADIAGRLRSYLDTVERNLRRPDLETFGRHLDTVSRSYGRAVPLLCDPGLPRDDNEVESHFRESVAVCS